MNEDGYVESALQRTLRVVWTHILTKQPGLLNLTLFVWAVVVIVGVFGGAVLSAFGITGVEPVLIIAVVCSVLLVAMCLLSIAAEKQMKRFAQHQRILREQAARERRRAATRPQIPRDPYVPDDEFRQALIAVLAEMHMQPRGYFAMELLVSDTVALTYADDDAFLRELERAQLARHYK
jgi:uncharacterized membrane protein YcjF (UPF0283 family)